MLNHSFFSLHKQETFDLIIFAMKNTGDVQYQTLCKNTVPARPKPKIPESPEKLK